LGESRPLDGALAGYLLPFMLDPELALFAQLRAPAPVSFALVTEGDGWIVDATSEGTRVTRGGGSDPPRSTIRAEPGWLALAVYGRVRVDTAAFEVEGPPATADQFAALFGPRE
jgi:hypothetical protein